MGPRTKSELKLDDNNCKWTRACIQDSPKMFKLIKEATGKAHVAADKLKNKHREITQWLSWKY